VAFEAETSCVPKPIDVNTRVALLAAGMLNVPSVAVWVAVFVPLTVTVTPGTPFPCGSTTLPVTVWLCALKVCKRENKINRSKVTPRGIFCNSHIALIFKNTEASTLESVPTFNN